MSAPEFRQSTAVQALALRVLVRAEANAALLLEASIGDTDHAERLADLRDVQALMREGYQWPPAFDAHGRLIRNPHLRLVRTEET